jgi:hypothetical protein
MVMVYFIEGPNRCLTEMCRLSFIVAIFYAAKIFLRYRKRMKGVVDKYISSETALMSGPYR